jgi:hypothetical protein
VACPGVCPALRTEQARLRRFALPGIEIAIGIEIEIEIDFFFSYTFDTDFDPDFDLDCRNMTIRH